jgi:hypothetical protein
VREAVAAERWVVDGNYSAVRDLVWARATVVVWLNLPFRVVFGRSLTRTFRRILTREELFNGNRERVANLVDRDGIPWWVLRTYHRRRRQYPELLSRPENAHLGAVELCTVEEVAEFLKELPVPVRSGGS